MGDYLGDRAILSQGEIDITGSEESLLHSSCQPLGVLRGPALTIPVAAHLLEPNPLTSDGGLCKVKISALKSGGISIFCTLLGAKGSETLRPSATKEQEVYDARYQ